MHFYIHIYVYKNKSIQIGSRNYMAYCASSEKLALFMDTLRSYTYESNERKCRALLSDMPLSNTRALIPYMLTRIHLAQRNTALR
jgi:c-di-AMP phosphodiesterase-like protein